MANMVDAKSVSRRIVVTGVSRGLGAALVHRFVAAGHTVAGCARDSESIDRLRTEHGTRHYFAAVDITQPADVAAWSQSVLSQHGVPDLVINNAGVINRNAPLWEVEVDDFERVLRTNIAGVFHVCRAFLPVMVEAGAGGIINFSSTWGQTTSPDVAPYCASKWAVEGMTQALAQELPAGLFAVACNPGIIDTEMLRSCFGAGAAGYPDAPTWSRVAAPFLLSLGPQHNGQSVRVPGD